MTLEAFSEKLLADKTLVFSVAVAMVFAILDCLTTQILLTSGYRELNPIFGGNNITTIWIYKLAALLIIFALSCISSRFFKVPPYLAPLSFGVATIIPVANNTLYLLGIL